MTTPDLPAISAPKRRMLELARDGGDWTPQLFAADTHTCCATVRFHITDLIELGYLIEVERPHKPPGKKPQTIVWTGKEIPAGTPYPRNLGSVIRQADPPVIDWAGLARAMDAFVRFALSSAHA